MRKFLTPVIVVIAAILYSSIVIVSEGTRGIMLRFSKVHRDADNKVVVYNPGLHFKIPFIDSIKILDARIRTLDGQADRFVTVEKKIYLWILMSNGVLVILVVFIRRQVVAIMPKRPIYYAVKSMTVYVLKRVENH